MKDQVYHSIFPDLSAELFCVLDEDSRVVWSNKAFNQVFDSFDPSLAVTDLFNASNISRFEQKIAEVRQSSNPQEITMACKTRDKQDHVIHWIICYHTAKSALCLIGQIQELKSETRRKLLKTIDILNETGSIAKVGGWEMDVATGELTWTDETFNILEVEQRIDQKPVLPEGLQLFAPEHTPIIAKAVQDAAEKGIPYSLELKAQTPKGNSFWVFTNGKPNYVNGEIKTLSGTIQNIDALKTTQLELEKALHKAESLQQTAEQYADIVSEISHLQRRFISGRTKSLFEDYIRFVLRITSSDFGFIAEVTRAEDDSAMIMSNSLTFASSDQTDLPASAVHSADSLDALLTPLLSEQKTIIINDLAGASPPLQLIENHAPVSRFMAIPLMLKNTLIGVIAVCNAPTAYAKAQLDNLGMVFASLETILYSYQQNRRLDKMKAIERSGRKALNEHAILSTTDTNSIITYVNDNFCKISGYSREELIGSHHNIISSNTHSEEFFASMYDLITNGDNFYGVFKNRNKMGEIYWVRATISPTRDEFGKIAGYLSIHTDITAEMRTINDRITENVVKDKFISNVSHEMRTPLNGINGFVSLLNLTPLNEEQQGYVDSLQECADFMILQMNQILDLGKLSSSDFDPVAIKPLMENLLMIEKPAMDEKNITLHFDCDDTRLNAGEVRMSSILHNLLSNAVKYNKKDGSLWFRAFKQGDDFVIVVKNNGHGIKKQHYEQIFEAFKRGDKARSNIAGTGLGLSIVQNCVTDLGGQVSVDSDGSSYSEFTVTLPINKVKD